MGLVNWVMQRDLRSEARKWAKRVSPLYIESKNSMPTSNEANVILDVAYTIFNKEELAQISESTKRHIEICCETIQGLCYMMALDAGRLKGLMNLRSLQFTHYMDKELAAQGFPPQSKEQKEKILKEMDLLIPNWDKITGDVNA